MSDPLLVSFEDAKAHLQIRDTTHDTDVYAKLTQASRSRLRSSTRC